MSATATSPVVPDIIMERLEEQIEYYEKKSATSQRGYKRIKLIEIIAAALIPFLAALQIPSISPNIASSAIFQLRQFVGIVTALLGVVITVLEGVLQLYQFHQRWITYRSTAEAMKHEKFIYLAKGGPYATAANPYALLAERIEALGSQENSKWASLMQQEQKGQPAQASAVHLDPTLSSKTGDKGAAP